jgi:hypothetical protein
MDIYNFGNASYRKDVRRASFFPGGPHLQGKKKMWAPCTSALSGRPLPPRAGAQRALPNSRGHGSHAAAPRGRRAGQPRRTRLPRMLLLPLPAASSGRACRSPRRGGSPAASGGRARPRFPRPQDEQACRGGRRCSYNFERELPPLARLSTDTGSERGFSPVGKGNKFLKSNQD